MLDEEVGYVLKVELRPLGVVVSLEPDEPLGPLVGLIDLQKVRVWVRGTGLGNVILYFPGLSAG